MDFNPFSDHFYTDPHHVFRCLREDAPVYYNKSLDFFALTRYDDVASAYRDSTLYSSAQGYDLSMVKSGDVPPNLILIMDPPEHGRLRGLVNKAFTPRAIELLRAGVVDSVQKYLTRADRGCFDVVADFSAPFPIEVIAHMLGVPDNDSQQVRRWTEEVVRLRSGGASDEASMKAVLELFGYYLGLVEAKRAQPSSDMISALISAKIAGDDNQRGYLDDLEIASFAMLLGGAGGTTVTKLVASAVAIFAQRPDQWEALHHDRRKVAAAVEEVLRFDGPVLYNVRCTTREVILHGVTIPAGKPVLLCTAAANRDPERFADPDTFDFNRNWSGAQHLGLGYGVHSCLGAALARLEAAIAIEHLLDFMPRYEVMWTDCQRTAPSNESGWNCLPVTVLR